MPSILNKCNGIKTNLRRRKILSLGCNAQEQMGHLTLGQRYEIEAYRNVGKSLSEIGAQIGKDKSVISRELSKNLLHYPSEGGF